MLADRSSRARISVEEESGTSSWVDHAIMVCRPPAEEGDECIRAYYAQITRMLAERPGPYVSVTDATGLDRIPNARERKLHGELINEMSKTSGDRCRAAILVVPSSVVRAAVTAITWLMDRKFPMMTAATLDEALEMAKRELSRNS